MTQMKQRHLLTGLALLSVLVCGLQLCNAAQDAEPVAQDQAVPPGAGSTNSPHAVPSSSASNSAPNTPTQPSTTTTTTSTTTTTTAKPTTPKNVNCPAVCNCTDTKMDCSNRQLISVPNIDPKSPYVEFNFSHNSLTSIDFRQFPLATVQVLDLSHNHIAQPIVAPTKKQSELAKLRWLDLSYNELDSASNTSTTGGNNFVLWKMPALRELNLAGNPLQRISNADFINKPQIKKLHLNQLNDLRSIDELALNPLGQLQFLNLSGSLQKIPSLPDQLFVKNAALDELDLSENQLIEVPVALRSTNGISKLYLNGNLMTSLRQSDFINRSKLEYLEMSHCNRLLRIDPNTFSQTPSLKKLILSNNERLHEISPLAFERSPSSPSNSNSAPTFTNLTLLDLSNNNLTTFSYEMPGLVFSDRLILANNPWDCSCSLKWMLNPLPNPGAILDQQPMHCASPSKFKDIEIREVLTMLDCQPEESTMQRFVLIVFLLFLIVLTVAIFVQRADICRRLQWRDQYGRGTIYYTKASFPTEQV
uniref:Leucine-rich repeat transmembrane protein FLRT1 n=1 Tax=Aceria tosichella TaxID=561515 RepID=A0A6G1S502_9ACAR